jgi:hypothetical protein
MDHQFLHGIVTASIGSLILLLPRSLFVLEGIGYAKPMRMMAIIMGLLFLSYGAFLFFTAG